MGVLCRACFRIGETTGGTGGEVTCRRCRSPRLVRHPEIGRLAIAHVDCDAFFASVEKARRPELAGRPVIVGGGERGVVTTACYVARLRGVGSAQPMARALRACPDAVVLRPDFPAYVAVARRLRAMMGELTPALQPLSIDEALLDLRGTETLHGAPPAAVLARFAARVERELDLTVSIGLAANPMLARLAAGRDKPRGFAVLGAEAAAVLAGEPVGVLPGVGPAAERKLARLGITRVGQLQAMGEREAGAMLGAGGWPLVCRARGEDARVVRAGDGAKSMAAETTLRADSADRRVLERALWPLCERLGARLRDAGLAADGVVLRLKTAGFVRRTRTVALRCPTMLPDLLFDAACEALARELDGTAFRLVGVGSARLVDGDRADVAELLDGGRRRAVARQAAVDALRARFGADVIGKGRGLG